jgi:glycine/D-amino acid oxidase-like deaminating enzyme
MTHFDSIVIGKGLVGAAAAKYLCALQHKVAVIGPDEPQENDSFLVYASHYDQARVQRIIGKDANWTRLNAHATAQYPAIQAQSGIHFHTGVGCLYMNPYGKDSYLTNLPALADEFGISTEQFTLDNRTTIKGFVFPAGSAGMFESAPSGYINPRMLLQAQLKLFAAQKGTHITDTVTRLVPQGENQFTIYTHSGQSYTAANVVVATGSFMNYLDVLPQKISLQTKSEVVLLARVAPTILPQFATLPSLLYELDEEGLEGIYLLPPVQYPDGHYYIKIGANTPMDIFFTELASIQDWFLHADISAYTAPLLQALKKLLPALPDDNVLTKKCIISRTPHGRPYISETATKGLFIAGGCNGYSAMCSDAMGYVASQLVHTGHLPDGYSPDAFDIVYDPV